MEISRIVSETIFDVFFDDIEDEINDGLILFELEKVSLKINLAQKNPNIKKFFRSKTAQNLENKFIRIVHKSSKF